MQPISLIPNHTTNHLVNMSCHSCQGQSRLGPRVSTATMRWVTASKLLVESLTQNGATNSTNHLLLNIWHNHPPGTLEGCTLPLGTPLWKFARSRRPKYSSFPERAGARFPGCPPTRPGNNMALADHHHHHNLLIIIIIIIIFIIIARPHSLATWQH